MSMPSAWKLKREIRKLRRYEANVRAKMAVALDAARGRGAKREELFEIEDGDYFEARVYSARIEVLESQLTIKRAVNYSVPVPLRQANSEVWNFSNEGGGWVLSDEAIFELRRSIREEQKYIREYWQSWLALTIGLMGALIGVISVWPSGP